VRRAAAHARGCAATVYSPTRAPPVGAGWQPLVAGGVQTFEASETATGTRLWGIGVYEPDSYLKYVDLP
jgi:hypothetical protein